MIARLILVLLLALGVAPVAAMPATCHADRATGVMTMAAGDAASRHRPRHDPAPADHACIGCAALRDVDPAPLAAPAFAPPAPPVAALVPLLRSMSASPALRPPRIG